MEGPEVIRAAGWRQGSVISHDEAGEQFRELLAHTRRPHAYWIVITQDCDLVHGSYEVEPDVELIGCNPAEKLDGNLSYGKNPRRIQFELRRGDQSFVAETCIHDRYSIERRTLERIVPCTSIKVDDQTASILVSWIGRRYTRSAFPDAFNVRLRQKQKGIKKLLEDHGDVISGIWLALSTFDELTEDKEYRVGIRLTMTPTDYADEAKRDRALRVCDSLEIGFSSCSGINIVQSMVVSESRFPLSDTRVLVPWDTFDYLSSPETA